MKFNVDKMNDFIEFFDNEVFPTVKSKETGGISHFRKIVEGRKAEVEAKKIKRSQILFQKEVEEILRTSVEISHKIKSPAVKTVKVGDVIVMRGYDGGFDIPKYHNEKIDIEFKNVSRAEFYPTDYSSNEAGVIERLAVEIA